MKNRQERIEELKEFQRELAKEEINDYQVDSALIVIKELEEENKKLTIRHQQGFL